MKTFITAIVICIAVTGCAELKNTGKAIGETTKEVTTDIGHAARDTTKAIGHASRDAVKSVKEDLSKED